MRYLLLIVVFCMARPLYAQDDPFSGVMSHLANSPLKRMIAQVSESLPIAYGESSDEDYTTLEAEMFARMNWGAEEIEWFRQTYGTDDNPSVFGSQREYILSVTEGYKALDEQSATNP